MTYTYITYFIILIISSLFAFCTQHVKRNGKIIFAIALFFALWLPAALRYGVGTDFYRYLGMVDSVRLGYVATELGYFLINYFVVYFNLDAQWAIVISSFLIIFLVLLALPKQHFTISVYIFVCLFYLPSFTLIRQAIAIGFIAVAIKGYINGSDKKFLFFVIIGSFFHLSAVMLLPFYLLAKIKISPMILFITILMTSLFIFIGDGLLLILSSGLLSESKYGFYAASGFGEDAEIGSGIGVIIKLILPLFFVFMSARACRLNYRLNILAWISAGCVVANICSLKIHIFSRVADIFLFTSFMVAPFLIDSIKKKVNKQLLILAIFIVFFAFYFRTIQANYNDDKGGIGVSPYQTIFSK